MKRGIRTGIGLLLAVAWLGCSSSSSDNAGPTDPQLSVSALIDFGRVEVGQSSSTGRWTLENVGSDSLVVTAISLSGAAAADFQLTTTPALPLVLRAGQSVAVELVFTPTAVGLREAVLTVTSNSGGSAGATNAVGFSGEGFVVFAAELAVSGSTDLGTSLVGTEAPASPTSITLSNTGTAALEISAIELSGADAGDFSLSGVPSLPTTVAIGGNLSVSVAFTPSKDEAHTASLDVRSNTLGLSNALTATALRGEGLEVSRDTLGIYFITGSPTADIGAVYEEFGYAMATDRLWQMELFRRNGRGTLAEVFGSGFATQEHAGGPGQPAVGNRGARHDHVQPRPLRPGAYDALQLALDLGPRRRDGVERAAAGRDLLRSRPVREHPARADLRPELLQLHPVLRYLHPHPVPVVSVAKPAPSARAARKMPKRACV